jgi:hypothetical protein
MNKAFESITSFVSDITSLLQGLVVLGIVVGILFDDYFGVIAGLGDLMSKFGDAGFAGLLALMLIVFWYLFFIPKYDEHQSKQASKSGIAKFAH